MDDFYASSDSDEEVVRRCKKDDDENKNELEQEFESFIEAKIRSDHCLEPSKEKVQFKQDDDLYDPDKDEEDEDYMQTLNRSNQFDDHVRVKSDATLNCPCCMTLLSMETQRHFTYKNQYRAMFTFNCKIDLENPVVETNKSNKRRKRNKQNYSSNANSNCEVYPVSCSICSTEVGVYDNDEVYHFYNCIASY